MPVRNCRILQGSRQSIIGFTKVATVGVQSEKTVFTNFSLWQIINSKTDRRRWSFPKRWFQRQNARTLHFFTPEVCGMYRGYEIIKIYTTTSGPQARRTRDDAFLSRSNVRKIHQSAKIYVHGCQHDCDRQSVFDLSSSTCIRSQSCRFTTTIPWAFFNNDRLCSDTFDCC